MAAGAAALVVPNRSTQSNTRIAAAPAPTPVSVAVVEQRDVALWDEFSGRLEAVERVEIRSRVAGAVQAVHFREGALVKEGDLLITIDPDPMRPRSSARRRRSSQPRRAWRSRKKEQDRGQQLQQSNSGAISQANVDQRVSAYREAEGNLRAARAALQSAQLNLGYTEVRAPVAGRVGKLEITVGNLVSRRSRRTGPDHAGVGRSDLRQLQRGRGSRDAGAERSLGANAHARSSTAFRCR